MKGGTSDGDVLEMWRKISPVRGSGRSILEWVSCHSPSKKFLTKAGCEGPRDSGSTVAQHRGAVDMFIRLCLCRDNCFDIVEIKIILIALLKSALDIINRTAHCLNSISNYNLPYKIRFKYT